MTKNNVSKSKATSRKAQYYVKFRVYSATVYMKSNAEKYSKLYP